LEFVVSEGFECLFASLFVDVSLSFKVEQGEDVTDLLFAKNTSFES